MALTTTLTNNAVKFVHFYGWLSEFNTRLASNTYKNSIVFAKTYDGNNGILLFIYAGKNADGVDYLYEVPTLEKMTDIEARLYALEEFTKIDPITNKFSKTINNAIERYLRDDSETILNINSSIDRIDNKLSWIVKDR